jgi:hypothetical protein
MHVFSYHDRNRLAINIRDQAQSKFEMPYAQMFPNVSAQFSPLPGFKKGDSSMKVTVQ